MLARPRLRARVRRRVLVIPCAALLAYAAGTSGIVCDPRTGAAAVVSNLEEDGDVLPTGAAAAR